MRYTWDPQKDAFNRRKHGLALVDGILAIEDINALLLCDTRIDYGEIRWVSIGMGRHNVLYSVWTERAEDLIRIISVRKAVPDEREKYDSNRA